MRTTDDAESKIEWRYAVGMLVLTVLGWYAFVRGVRVPILGAADLGFHEFGHLLFMWAPPPVQALMGSGTQVCVPLGLAAYFLWRRDTFAGALMLGWAATAAQDVSVYVADAPFQQLPLIGGYHDWAYLLGPGVFDAMEGARFVAGTMWTLGALLLIAAFALCAAGLARRPLEARRQAREQARLATLPVREPRSRPLERPDGAVGVTAESIDAGDSTGFL